MKNFILITIATLSTCFAFSQKMDSSCICKINNASYTGPYLGVEDSLKPENIYLDLKCAKNFKDSKFPNGFITIFGSSRITEKSTDSAHKHIAQMNDKLYKFIKDFAYLWTKKHGKSYPILTGAGPGLMEAGSRGAYEAGGPSIGFTTYYGKARDDKNPSLAFQKYRGNDIITDGLIFTSIVTREYSMIINSKVMIFAPGGTGTEWELFQTIEKIKSKQLDKIPIYLIGDKATYWKYFYDRINEMVKIGALDQKQFDDIVAHIVTTPDDLMNVIENGLNK